MIVFTATGRCAKIKADEPITTGSVGMPVSVVLSGDFDGLAATMVFACGDVSADVALLGQEVTVPPQVLEEAGRVLEIGVYGARADGTIVIPTVWAKAGIVHEGVLPSGVDPAEPMPSWPAQVQQWAEDAHDTAEQLAQDVENWEAEIDTAIENARDATQDATQTAASIAQAESSRVTAEQGRASAESSRAAAETGRSTAESARDEAEQARVTAEQGRATAEQGRAAAESSRASAESSRVTAEQARATAESSRAAAETGRSTAESARDESESARSAAEATRAENEGTRVTNESARVNAESARDAAETTRATAEQSRDTAETERASAESVRVTAEQGRASAENARASAESARATAESARASAETSRATAETARASAETARATEWAEIEPAAQSATQSATVAAALATRAAAAATAVVAGASNGNVPYGTLTGTVLTADDAWSAFAKSVGVYGKSTQAGTPTPSSPAPILSVDALTLHASADGTTDYTNWPVQIPLSDHIARSLPDGTCDELTLSYIGSSETEGWGVYSKTLVQRVGVATINASEWQNQPAVSIGDGWYRTVKDVLRGAESVVGATATQGMCTAAPFVYNTTLQSEHVGTQNMYLLLVAQESSAAAIAAKYDGATVIYKLKTPVTHDLGTVELPVNPAPDLTAWADGGSAQPTMSMEYEQDINIVIGELRSAIADMATS